MMKSVHLSYIIPAYNASEFIADTIASICRQNWQRKVVEVIVIDDGSTDATADIVKLLQKNNAMIVYARQENSGPSAARNYGLVLARGEYVSFADADDMLTKDGARTILRAIDANDCDLYVFGFNLINAKRDKTLAYGSSLGNVESASSEYVRKNLHVLYEDNLLNQVWNKVLRTDFVRKNNLTFQDYKYGEDRLFVLDAIKAATKMKIIDHATYQYYIRHNESLISKFYDKKFEVSLKLHQMAKDVASVGAGTSHEIREIYEYMFVKSIVACVVNLNARSYPYGYREKRVALRQILAHPEVKKSLAYTFNRPLSFRLVVGILRSRNITLGLLLVNLITFTDRFMPLLFIRFKHGGGKP